MTSEGSQRAAAWPEVVGVASQLAPPPERAGIVARDRLLARLLAAPRPLLVAIAAPPGYGKTTLLVQWIHREPRPTAWLSLDTNDNDPAVLLARLVAALRVVDAPWDRVEAALARRSRPPSWSATAAFLGTLGAAGRPFVLVLDDFHLLSNPDALDVIRGMLPALPLGSTLAVASRDVPPLPLGRLRARGQLRDLGANDLALDEDEAARLLAETGLQLLAEDVRSLAARTEGWAAGLYLAALSIQASQSTAAVHVAFQGTDRFVTDYLRSELLSRLSPDDLGFLRRTAVLDEMCGPLVDHVLEVEGSARRLEDLERANLFVVPLDRDRRWYRYHALFRELLRADIATNEPGVANGLLARAAAWYHERGDRERALELLFEAGEHERAAELFADIALRAYWDGRLDYALTWAGRFGPSIERYSGAATLAGWAAAMVGDAVAAARLADAAGRAVEPGGVEPPGLASLRAVQLIGGLDEAGADAERDVRATAHGHAFQFSTLVIRAEMREMAGDTQGAERDRREIAQVSAGGPAAPERMIALSQLALRAIDQGDWSTGEALARRAAALAALNGLGDYSTAAFCSVAAARIAIHRGDRRRALEELVRAQRLRTQLTHAVAPFAVEARVEMGHAYLALGDTAGARAMVDEAEAIRQLRPELGTLLGRLAELGRRAAAAPSGRAGASTLTPAELRLLPYLATHLSFRETSTRLGVSANTVKTQAGSIYAKLEVGSRSEAVERAREIGLLES